MPRTGYSRAQIALHWLTLLLIAPQFLLHDGISAAWRAFRRGTEVVFDPLVAAHVGTGIVILLLTLWRLSLRLGRGAPPPPAAEHPALKLVAGTVHWGLYALLLLLPLSGLAAWFGGIETAAEAHELLKNALFGLVGLHVLGALYHQFVLKTDLMARMKRPEA